jgi:ribosome recycling factor
MFNKIVVDYYDTLTPLNQLASFQTPEARMIIIVPYDKGAFGAIEKALRDSDLGINPTSDGNLIRVVLPQLTEERRREYIKVAKNKAEEARVSIRNIRRHAKDQLDRMQKDGEAGEDDVRRAEKHLDDVTHKQVEHIDEVLKHKEAELLEV